MYYYVLKVGKVIMKFSDAFFLLVDNDFSCFCCLEERFLDFEF